MIFHWPQIVWLGLSFILLCLTAALHGQKQTGEYNFHMRLCGFLFSIWLLWCGGFFG